MEVLLDNACGSGIIAEEILKINPNVKIVCTDFSDGMVSMVKRKIEKNGWKNVEAEVQNAQDLKFPDNTFDVSVINFGIMFSDEDPALSHIFRTLKPGGTAVVTTWSEVEHLEVGLEVARRIAGKEVKPQGKLADILVNGWSRPDWIKEAFKRIGFPDVKITLEEDLMEYKESFMALPKVWWKESLSYDFSQEDKDRWDPEWDKLIKEKIDSKAQLKMVAIISIATKK
eukprot:TRINITY_DN3114_c0_g2_i1.p1 TRINITY_DN3114_c0_g2~~TRINITY_DN3114_c0_g2_i1.p1  ORF type:complete len:228 (-),score=75.61 TRINITY_DN3114_c0_g2_i1:41-724(-)